MPDTDQIEETIRVLSKFTHRDIAILICFVTFLAGSILYVENRYAKLKETQDSIGQHQTQLMQLQRQILSVVNSLPENIRKEIVERSALEKSLQPTN